MARHEVARIETAAQRLHDGVHRRAVDAVAVEDGAQRVVAPHRHLVAVVAEHHFRERDRTGEGERGAVSRVAAVRSPCGLDVAVLSCLDADGDRDAPALAVGAEQEPHLTADFHAPEIGPFLDRLADPVGVHGANAGSAQQEGQAVAAPDSEGLQLRLGLDGRRRDRRLHRRGQGGRDRCDQRKRRNSTDPPAIPAIHISDKPLHHTRFRRCLS